MKNKLNQKKNLIKNEREEELIVSIINTLKNFDKIILLQYDKHTFKYLEMSLKKKKFK